MKTTNYFIRISTFEDVESILELYKRVSESTVGLARTESEITREYVQQFTEKSIRSGIQLVMVDRNDVQKVIAEIHCYKLEPSVFAHIFSELTIAVCPDHQGQKLGRTLFQALLDFVQEKREDILRVELIARESNTKAIHLYESLGFVKEGRLRNRIRLGENFFEADIPMAWFNPSFTNS